MGAIAESYDHLHSLEDNCRKGHSSSYGRNPYASRDLTQGEVRMKRWPVWALLFFAADQVSKFLAFWLLENGDEVSLVGSWVLLTPKRNPYFMWGLGRELPGVRLLVAAGALLAAGILTWLYLKKLRGQFPASILKVFMILAVAGTAGNGADRVFAGAVRDFVRLPWFGTCNLADFYMTGAEVVLALMLLQKWRWRRSGELSRLEG